MSSQTITASTLDPGQSSNQAAAQLGREWRLKNWGALLFIAGLWTVVLMHLAVDWRFNPEYRFGWFAPVMMALVLASRLGKGRPRLTANRARMPRTVFWFFVTALAAWPLTRMVGIANPDWHLFSWITVISGLILTLATLHSMGGTKMMRHYGIPFLMVAAVVPWPFFLELHLISTLKSINAMIVTEVLQLSGIAAVRETGGIITMPNAVLGIEEGCTGIRSLHLCLAVALFWGEWFRLPLKGRASLVAFAFLVAILVNVVRTVSLAVIAHQSGPEVLDQWHDLAGIFAQAIVVGICWMLTGWLIARQQRWSRNRFLKSSNSESREAPMQVASVRLKGIVFCLATVWILGCETGARFWFNRPTGDQRASQPWRWSIPPSIDGLRPMRLPPQWRALLAADGTFAGTWIDKSKNRIRYLYSFHWQEGRPAALFATHHRPEDCLPGSGFELVGSPERVAFPTKNGARPFELNRYSFRSSDGVPLTVFHGTYADDKFTESQSGGLTRQRRFNRAIHGEGFPDTRLLEIIFWDTDTSAAQAEMEQQISSIVVLSS
ncbi:MAG: exosortase/archaeosortase family protein [Verrucomicrobiae bacterium]|nr:exosortase/archaeosortase family protein [Verrucomicrobiae bacterium]